MAVELTDFESKIKEKYRDHRNYQSVFYVVYDHQRRPTDLHVAALGLRPRLGLPYAQQMVPDLQRGLQHSDILIHRPVQNHGHNIQPDPIHSPVNNRIKKNSARSVSANLFLFVSIRVYPPQAD